MSGEQFALLAYYHAMRREMHIARDNFRKAKANGWPS